MSQVNLKIESYVNEIFVKTIVTQKFTNPYKKPLELKIIFDKIPKILFKSFQAKIGDSIMVKSKVIEKEKAEIKYTDSISSGNASIFVIEHENEEKLTINMGNIPPKEEVIFISEFIYFIKHSTGLNSFIFQIFRIGDLPIFKGNDEIFSNSKLIENVHIKTINRISNIEKDISFPLKIIKEKFLNEEKTEYLISLEKLPDYGTNSSTILFDTIYNEPLVFLQKSTKLNKDNYIIQYKYNEEKSSEEELSPALFIFLIDQSGSMCGERMTITKKALEIFLQSLPAKSYYQLIGFGSKYVKYDEIPKEYTKENIEKSLNVIKHLWANLGATNIYEPLLDIYCCSDKIYDKIKLNRKIFLLTDGYIGSSLKETLNLIKNNNYYFTLCSIGIGDEFDEDLVEGAGINGKGGYNFCKNLDELNSIIAKEIYNTNIPWVSDFNIKCSLDNDSNITREMPETIKKDDLISTNYIIPRKNIDKINVEITYILDNRKKIVKNYEIIPTELPEGEEINKLIINDYINKINDEEEKKEKSLKYQIFNKYTSLFAEVELSNKISDEIKLKIIGDKKNNTIIEKENYYSGNWSCGNYNMGMYGMNNSPMYSNNMSMNPMMGMGMMPMNMGMSNMNMGMPNMMMGMPNMNMSMPNMNMSMPNMMMGMGMNQINSMNMEMINNIINKSEIKSKEEKKISKDIEKEKKESSSENESNSKRKEIERKNLEEESKRKELESKKLEEESKRKEIEKKKLEEESNAKRKKIKRTTFEEKNKFMEIIKTQDFIEGFWEINDKTKIIIEKYKKEYELLKGLKDKNINDKIALTILVIYYINNEYFDLIGDLVMIIKKAKLFIKKEINFSYEEIIEQIKSI